ncbi:MAG: adenosylmethionine--8-amino-7-oxononanoate transaminase, partial [Sulfuriflexus sp.]|nr:adenosylmethionine--8-amino-7-oxononanoate transaminase [Sulfuriflexus sp.]
SSWWVNLFGHCNPRINEALKQQLDTLEHVMLAGFSHETVIELSERLVALTPPTLKRCFYADNGSSAVEVALKMSFHYWHNTGQHKKKRFISLSNSYHGETLGALSLGDVKLYKDTYGPLMLDTITVKSPDCYHRETGESCADYSVRLFAEMENTLQQYADECCAVIVEPLIQCAGGMRMYDPIYLSMLREACDRHNVHLIADEVAVGFGRTGSMFACEQASISPDFLCIGKGLTGGYLPLAVTLTTEEIYSAFYDDYTNLTGFMHSHSYTGNALGCRAALATLDIFATDNVIETNKGKSVYIRQAVAELEDHPHVAEIRQHGMVLAMELVKNKQTKQAYDWKERRGLKVYEHGLKNNVLLRPIGNVVYFIPPYIINNDEIDLMTRIAIEGINIATSN